MPARTKPEKPADDSAGITDTTLDTKAPEIDSDAGQTAELPDTSVDTPVVDPEPESKVMARYVGIEPVLAHIDGESVIIEPGDQIPVSAEQLEQNPVFQPWED